MDRLFRLLNVFAIEGDPFSGNPLCVFEDARGLSDRDMQAWSRQFNLSESSFVTRLDAATAEADIRIFTPAHEMPFAGHPTLGTAHVVAELAGDRSTVHLSMPAGRIPVTRTENGWRLSVPEPVSRPVESTRAELAAALGLDATLVAPAGARWVDAGVEQVVVRLESVDAVRSCRPDALAMARHMTAPGRPPHAYAWAWTGPETIEARLFYTQDGAVLEDPATGSACANLGGWLRADGAAGTEVLVSQGTAVGRPSRLELAVREDGSVEVGGAVVEVGSGTVT
ncbi:phenazine biosynthesis protein PhzF family [Intrasporangium oryzae NRRL B-24470]|uniref:Phenazine biosynthesis protein PhzF family n=1 Tax=Intrasporangium oryzae NRRL B-24470 TaxID=1386089 RepID=W9G476_9MICO|nr:PhzF family phenazine biosynthesis protein [Intrasporangium oryzae]EWT00102.1 phenazine biosynthesis protein PhzF family [Intrasporangium oryzae NRRL B-24470]